MKWGVWVSLSAFGLSGCAGEIDRRDELGLQEEGVRSEVVELKSESPVQEQEELVGRPIDAGEIADSADGAGGELSKRADAALVSFDPRGKYTVQVGGYRDAAKAHSLVRELSDAGYPAYAIARIGSEEVRVRIGYFNTQADAERFGERFKADRAMEYWVDKRENE